MGEPISLSFNDRYFYKQDGLGESSYVFINGNDLTNRWKRLKKHESFTIGELGFGTGLNFLNALKEWKAAQPDSWFGNTPTIINSGQMGVEEAALEIHNRKGYNTGGTAPAGFINNPVSNPKIFPQKGKEYNLTPLYKNEGVTPGNKIDSAEVYKYIYENASDDFKNHINKLSAMGYDDVMLKLAETYIFAKPLPKDISGNVEYQKGFYVKKGKAAEF